MALLALAYVYVPTADADASSRGYVEALGARLAAAYFYGRIDTQPGDAGLLDR